MTVHHPVLWTYKLSLDYIMLEKEESFLDFENRYVRMFRIYVAYIALFLIYIYKKIKV